MIPYFDIEQGSSQWHSLRAGIPTSSEFGNIITPSGMRSKSLENYAGVKAMEIMLKRNILNDFANEYMDRGKILEAQAAEQYEVIYGVDTKEVGFITNDDGTVGASPDRLTSDCGGLEIKCFGIHKHIHHYFSKIIDPKYKPQMQGQIFVGNLDYVANWMYHPEIPPVRIMNMPDDKFLTKLEKLLVIFRQVLADKVGELIDDGHIILPKEAA